MRAVALALVTLMVLSIPAAAIPQQELKELIEGLRTVLGERAEEIAKRSAFAADVTEAIKIIMEELSKERDRLERINASYAPDEEFRNMIIAEVEEVVEFLSSVKIAEAQLAESLEKLRAGQLEALHELSVALRQHSKQWSLALAVKAVIESPDGAEKKLEVIDVELKQRLPEVIPCVRPIAPPTIGIAAKSVELELLRDLIARCGFQVMPMPEDPGRISISISLGAIGSISIVDPQRVSVASDKEKGSEKFENIGTLVVPAKTAIIVKISEKVDGKIILGGVLTLRGEKLTYKISMPGFVATEPFVRIMMVIPGYDAPLEIEPGKYAVDLEIFWDAKGHATVIAELNIVEGEFKVRI